MAGGGAPPNMFGGQDPTVLRALLLGAGGRNPFDPNGGYTGGNMADGGQPPNWGGTAPRTGPMIGGPRMKPRRTPPGQIQGMPTAFNPGQIDPSKIGPRGPVGEPERNLPAPGVAKPTWGDLPGLKTGQPTAPLGKPKSKIEQY